MRRPHRRSSDIQIDLSGKGYNDDWHDHGCLNEGMGVVAR